MPPNSADLCQFPGQTGDTRHQLMWLNRFGQVQLKAGGEGTGAIFTAGAGRYRYGGRIASTVPHELDQLVTAAAGHRYVADQDLRAPGGHDAHGLVYAAGGPHIGISHTENGRQKFSHVGLIVHDQRAQPGKLRRRIRTDGLLTCLSCRRRLARKLFRKRRRERDFESRAFAFAGALGPDSSAVHLHQALHNGQSQSQSAVLSGNAPIGLAKPIEDKRQEFWRDSDAGVDHLDFGISVEIPEANFHDAPRRGELDGVMRQIPDHLPKPVEVKQEHMYGRVKILLQTHPFGLRLRAYRFDPRLDNGSEIGKFNIQREIAGADGRDIEQVVNQFFLRAGVALASLQGALLAFYVEALPPDERDPTEHGGQRRTQLVRDGGEKFIFQAVGLFGFRLRRLRSQQALGAFLLGSLAVRDLLFQRGGVALQVGVKLSDLFGFPVKFDEDRDLRFQRVRVNRLGDVIYRAERIALGDVRLAPALVSGQEDDRDVARAFSLADQRRRLNAVHLGHAHVQQDNGRIPVEQELERFH